MHNNQGNIKETSLRDSLLMSIVVSWRKIYSSRSKIRSKIQDDPSTVLLTIYRDHAKLERHLTFKIRKPLVGTRRCNRVHSVRTRNVCLSIIHLRLYCILHSIFKSAWCKISFFFFFFRDKRREISPSFLY